MYPHSTDRWTPKRCTGPYACSGRWRLHHENVISTHLNQASSQTRKNFIRTADHLRTALFLQLELSSAGRPPRPP